MSYELKENHHCEAQPVPLFGKQSPEVLRCGWGLLHFGRNDGWVDKNNRHPNKVSRKEIKGAKTQRFSWRLCVYYFAPLRERFI
jgi:hypothetical protein